MAKKPLEIDMCAGSQLRDTQGEMLAIEGADISDLLNGKGRLNDNHGKGFFNSIGRVTSAKKIFKAEDCEDDRQKYYWEKVKSPYLYVRGFLYDDEDHPNAKAAAAILRNIHKADVPLKIKASVEGGVVSRGLKDPTLLAQTKIHSVALTFTPANNATLVEPISLDKSNYDEEADRLLIKSVMHLAEVNVPNFRAVEKIASAAKIAGNLRRIRNLVKTMKSDDMEKGIKGNIAGAAMMGASMLAPTPTAKEPPQPVQQESVQPKVDHGKFISAIKSSNPFLYALAQQESSGGKNLNHKTMNTGQHNGMTAGGPWGLMPKTAAYILKNNPMLAEKYPDIASAAEDVDKNHLVITKAMNEKPGLALDFASALVGHLKKIHKGDPNKVFHSWYHGLKGTSNAVRNGEDLNQNDYVKGVKRFYQEPKKRSPAQKKMKKALTAGYGGASAPTSRVGGTVMMSESLEKPKGFKYITCDHCGKEQIYAKHQVKCRHNDCGKAFSFEKLSKLITK